MKKILLFLLFCSVWSIGNLAAQDEIIYKNTEVDTPAQMAKEDQKAFFGKVMYPASARENGIEGKVIMQLTIDEQGNIIDDNIISRTYHDLNKEVRRVLKLGIITKLTPASHQGKNVKVYYDFFVNFSLPE